MTKELIQKYIAAPSAANIAAGVEAAIREGTLAADDQLPTVRGLAARLGVSSATVAAAYRSLRRRGVIVTDGRRGTRVSRLHAPRPVRAAGPPPPGVRDLSTGNPDPALLPSMAPALAAIDPSPVLYGQGLSLPALVDAVSPSLRADGVPSGPLCVVSGAMTGIEAVLRETLRPGDRVAVEDPGYNMLEMSLALGLIPVPVPLDDDGIRPESLSRAVDAGARAVVVTPRAQNPTGAALSAERAGAVRAVLAAAPDVLVVEDDHAALVTDAPPVFVCQGWAGRWALARSLSKALNPDLRLAVLTGDPETLARVEDRLVVGERWVSHILQRLAAVLLTDPEVSEQLERAARVYRRRREALLAALAGAGLGAAGRSGFNVWLPVDDEAGVVQALAYRGWAVAAGARFRLLAPPAIRITTAMLDQRDAPRLAADVADAVRGRGRGGVV